MKEVEINNAFRLLSRNVDMCMYACIRSIWKTTFSILRVYIPIRFLLYPSIFYNTKEFETYKSRKSVQYQKNGKEGTHLGRYTLKCIISPHIFV